MMISKLCQDRFAWPRSMYRRMNGRVAQPAMGTPGRGNLQPGTTTGAGTYSTRIRPHRWQKYDDNQDHLCGDVAAQGRPCAHHWWADAGLAKSFRNCEAFAIGRIPRARRRPVGTRSGLWRAPRQATRVTSARWSILYRRRFVDMRLISWVAGSGPAVYRECDLHGFPITYPRMTSYPRTWRRQSLPPSQVYGSRSIPGRPFCSPQCGI